MPEQDDSISKRGGAAIGVIGAVIGALVGALSIFEFLARPLETRLDAIDRHLAYSDQVIAAKLNESEYLEFIAEARRRLAAQEAVIATKVDDRVRRDMLEDLRQIDRDHEVRLRDIERSIEVPGPFAPRRPGDR